MRPASLATGQPGDLVGRLSGNGSGDFRGRNLAELALEHSDTWFRCHLVTLVHLGNQADLPVLRGSRAPIHNHFDRIGGAARFELPEKEETQPNRVGLRNDRCFRSFGVACLQLLLPNPHRSNN